VDGFGGRCALVGLLVGLACVSAPVAVAEAAPFGSLTQLPGVQGCVRDGGGLGCARARGIGVTSGVAVSPEGRNVYAVGVGVGVFSRDQASGELVQLGGRDGCFINDGSEGCARGRGLSETEAVAVSQDGRNVYVAGSDGAVAVFARDQSTGVLRQPGGRAACIRPGGRGGCSRGRALGGDFISVIVSADGRNVYVASGSLGEVQGVASGAVAVFARDQATGALRQLAGRAGCSNKGGRRGCTPGRALGGASSVAASPDGSTVYVAAPGSDAVAVFRRSQPTGALQQLRGARGYARGSVIVPSGLTVSPDGHHVYAVGSGISAFTRDQTTGALRQPRGRSGCVGPAEFPRDFPGCARGRGIDSSESVTVSPDGRNLYVAASNPDSLAGVGAFAREQASGGLRQLAGESGCIGPRGRGGCARGRALQDTGSVAVSSDGRNLYVASLELNADEGGAVAVFARTLE
jgi:DNA-binding beta-propeller fold protein YncE